MKKSNNPRIYVELTAFWGNDDAESTIKLSRRRWKAIRAGAEYSTSAWSWYEGKRDSVAWSFTGGNVTIDGKDGRQCKVENPVEELIVQVISPDKELK